MSEVPLVGTFQPTICVKNKLGFLRGNSVKWISCCSTECSGETKARTTLQLQCNALLGQLKQALEKYYTPVEAFHSQKSVGQTKQ